MSWIPISRVEALVRADLSSDQFISDLVEHVEGLVEMEVGQTATENPSSALVSVAAAIVARSWQAGHSAAINPAGFQSETTGPFTFQDTRGGTIGLGLTDREKRSLKRAAGISSGVSVDINSWFELEQEVSDEV